MTPSPLHPYPTTTDRQKWSLIAATLVSALGFIDGSVISIATPMIRESLGATLVQSLWFSSAYMLPVAALILVAGAAGDKFGINRITLIGIVIFLIGAIASSASPTPEIFIVNRLITGTGAGLMIPGALALIARAYPTETRGRAIGIWAAASAILTALGPLIAGALLSTNWDNAWRFIFAVNLPIGLIAIYILTQKLGRDRPIAERDLDWLGAILIVAALGATAFSLSRFGQSDVRLYPYVVLAVVATLAFVFWEARTPHPMLPIELLRRRAFAVANIITFCLYFSLSAMMFYLPMTVISAWGVSPLAAAISFAPLSIFIGLLSSRIGRLSERIGPRPIIAAGSLLAAVAFVAMAITVPERNFWGIVVPLNAALGIGMAFIVGPLSTSVMDAVSEPQMGTASGVNNAVSRMSGLMAVAGMGSVAALAYNAAGGTLSYGAIGQTELHLESVDAGFQAVIWTTAGLSVLSALLALFGLPARKAAD